MPSLLESVTDLLGQGDTFATLGQLMEGDTAQAKKASGVVVPALIGGLASRATVEGGPAVITELLDGADRGPVDDVGAFLDAGDGDVGTGMLDAIFGDDRSDLVSALADKVDIDGSMITRLLPMLTPVVVGLLDKRRSDDDLDEAGIVGFLESENEALESDGLLDTISDFFGGGLGKAAGAAAAAAGAGAALGSKALDTAGDVGDAAGDAVGAVAEAAGDAAGAAADAAGEAADAISDAAGDAKDAVAAKLGGVKEAVTGGGGVDDDRNGGLGWLWWALGAVVLVLLLAWALSTCNETSDGEETSANADAQSDADSDSDEDAENSGGEDADTDGSGSDGDDDVMADDDADSSDDASDDDASDGDVSSSDEDDGAMTEEDSTDADAELEVVLAAALAGSGVEATVVDGVVTLTGDADSEAVRDGLVEAIGTIEGVSSVDDQIVVNGQAEEPEQDGEDDGGETDDETEEPETGDTINDLLNLDPVTFRISSARITDAGQAVLDEAATYLEENPGVNVEIGGHTDDDGAGAENLVLSQRRADSVKAYLESKGIDGDRMEAVGYGEEKPKVPNDSSLAKAENRRIEFTVL